jgi:iron(III) transport system ATP-binding protein
MVDCQALLDRYPSQLSGGQQQLVALARGLVARPDLVLFDEPMSNLDARLRDQVRAQLHELHGRLGFTAVFVTHDQSEALALGDRLAIMKAGRIEQLDHPQRVFEEPSTEYVAGFIGMSNRLVLRRLGTGWSAGDDPAGDGPVTGELPLPPAHTEVVVRLRPDDLLLARPDQQPPPGTVAMPAQVVDAQFGGRHMDVVVTAGGTRLHAKAPLAASPWTRHLTAGEPVRAWFAERAAVYFGPGDERIAGHVPTAAVGA